MRSVSAVTAAHPARENQPGDDQDVGTQRALESITKELGALREQAAAKEKREAARDAKPGPPLWSNWILIFVTGGAVVAAFRTLGEMRTQVEVGRRASDAAHPNAIAAVANARAAKAAAETAEQHMYLAMRARMGFVRIRPVNLEPWGATVFRLRFRNFGGKGAEVIDCHAMVTLGPLPQNPTYAGGIHVILVSPCEAGEKTDLSLTMLRPLADDSWASLHATPPGIQLHIHGVLRYMPGMTKEVKHVGFCRRYDPLLSKIEGKPVFVGAGPDRYNFAD